MKHRFAVAVFIAFTLALFATSPTRAEVPPGTLQPNDLLVYQHGTVSVYNGTNGAYKGDLVVGPSIGPTPLGMTIGPDGNLYVSDGGMISIYNSTTGTALGQIWPFTPDSSYPVYSDGSETHIRYTSGIVPAPVGIAFLPDGNLYVGGNSNSDPIGGDISRFDIVTGQYIDTPVPFVQEGTLGMGYTFPQDLVAGADGNLYFSNYEGPASILRYNPITHVTETFVPQRAGVQGNAQQFAFGPDGNLYVTSPEFNSVERYNGTTGAYMDDFVSSGSGGLFYCLALAFGPDGNLYVSSYDASAFPDGDIFSTGNILRFDGKTGAFMDVFVPNVVASHILFNKGVTQTGSNIPVTPTPTTTLTFDSITTSGQTTVTPLSSDTVSLPANFQIAASTGGIPTYFDITTTATFTGQVALGIAYDPTQFRSDQNPTGPDPLLLHFTNGAWVNITASVDTVNHKVYGNTASFSPFAIAGHAAYSWSGVLQPINTNGSSVFKLGSTIPVKFKLTGGDAGITNLQAKLYISQKDSVEPSAVNEATSTAAADSGNTFRYDSSAGQYLFNLSTKGLSKGTWYLRIDLGDGTNNVVQIKLK